MIACPNCGYKQPESPQCIKCSSLFSYYSVPGFPQPVAGSSAPFVLPRPEEDAWSDTSASAGGLFRRVRAFYRVFRWVSPAAFVILILLIMHKSPPPKVQNDPQAVTRAESKLADARAAVEQGRPYQLTLDGTELNSFLGANLVTSANSSARSTELASSPEPSSSTVPSSLSASPSSSDGPQQSEPTVEQVQSSVEDFKVDLVGDLVKTYLVFNFHGKDLSLELDGHLSSSNGYIEFQPVSGQLGSLPLPQSILQSAVDKLLSSPENKEKLRLPDGIRDIQIVDGQLVVSYQ